MPDAKYCRAPNWGLTPDGRCNVCGLVPTAAPAQAEPRDPVVDCPYPHFAGRRVIELEEAAAKAIDRAIRAEAELAGLKAAARVAAPSPAAEDGLVELDAAIERATLAAKVSGMTAPTREEAIKSMDVAKQREEELRAIVAARIERQAQEIADLRTLIENATRDKRIDGKTLVDFVYLWRDQAEDRSRKAESALAAALRRAEALHMELRGMAIDSAGFDTKTGYDAMMCLCCSCKWWKGAPEEHIEGCLASPCEGRRPWMSAT